MSNGTWEVVDRPYGCQPIGCKWIFKKKLRPDGTIERYKTRLMAKGYTQKEGEDLFDTYSPVARLTTVRTLIVVVASYGLIIHQMDVKTTFLNGELDEEIYMDQPEGFITDGQENKVCRLIKSLYGLKQAPKQWHEKFDNTLTATGFAVNEVDTCVYYRYGGGESVMLCLYVDDILIFGSNLNVIEEVKNLLSSNFEMKDLGEADIIPNIKFVREGDGGVTLLQSYYVEKVLSRFGFSDCDPAPTLSAFRPRGVPGPTSKLSLRAPSQMGWRETGHEGEKNLGSVLSCAGVGALAVGVTSVRKGERESRATTLPYEGPGPSFYRCK
jgi:hypothetical protein